MPAEVRNPAGHWLRNGTTLKPIVAGDVLEIGEINAPAGASDVYIRGSNGGWGGIAVQPTTAGDESWLTLYKEDGSDWGGLSYDPSTGDCSMWSNLGAIVLSPNASTDHIQCGGSVIPFVSKPGTLDIGSNITKFRDLWLSRNAAVGGTLKVDGNVGVGCTPSGNAWDLFCLEGSRAANYMGMYLKNTHAAGISRFNMGMTLAETTLGMLMQYDANSGLAVYLNRKATTGQFWLGTTGGYMKIENDASVTFKDKSKMTPIGGFAVKLTNRTGAGSISGQVVIASIANADSVTLAGANELMPIGVFLDTGVANGAEAWIVVSGIAEVRLVAGGAGCALGDRLITDPAGGNAVANNAPAVAVHFQEIGHAVQAAAAGFTARTVLHFL